MRSLSRSGLSVVTVVFEENVETYFGRQLILEKLREAEESLPPGADTPELGPVSTGLGEIFRYVVRDTTGRLSPMELRTIHDWIVRRQLLGVPGLAEVNAIGGFLKQYQVLVDPEKLAAYNLTLRDVFDAAAASSGTGGGAYIETGPEQLTVRSVGLATSLDDLRATAVKTTAGGTPVLLGDVAEVTTGPAIRFGAATRDGEGEVVTGFTLQLKGANARVVVGAVKDRIAEIQASLPEGVVIEPYYDRTQLVARTIKTVAKNLGEGALLVIAVLLLLLAHLRSGLILASVIPLAMLFAVICMVLTGQSGNLMSLGAIDFGLVVDGSLIIVENILRLISKHQREGRPIEGDDGMRRLVYAGAVEMVSAAKFGVFIIIIVYLPILTLRGIEGKLFQPMALTVTYALVGALLLSVTYVPVMCSLFLKGGAPIRHAPVVAWLHRVYRPALRRALAHGRLIVGVAALLLAVALVGFTRLGGEFLPRLDEGDVAMQILRLPSVSLTESLAITGEVERRVAAFDEVETIVSNTGRPEVSTDPMGVEIADAYIILKPRDAWPEVAGRRRTKAELVEAMREAVEDVPGAGVQFLQPIEMRTNELVAGARGDVAVKLFGEDFGVMNPAAERVAAILRATPGGADVSVEQTSGFPQLVVRPDRAVLARYGLTPADINDLVETAVGGRVAGAIYEGERRFDLVVRYRENARGSVTALRQTLVATPTGARVPLEVLARVAVEEGPAQISRDEGSRYVTVQANVRGRDVASFVESVQAQIAAQVDLPPGYRIAYGGQFENLQNASRRLALVVPLALVLIFFLLFQAFRSARLGVLIFLCVPMAVIGGVAALFVAGLPFSISAGVGFIALFGIAVLNGIVMVAAFRKFEGEGLTRRDAILAGADERLRPVVTTATLAALGFVPMLLARSAGAEVQRPLATVVIGGLVSSTLLTLFVLPIVYGWFGGRRVQWQQPEPEDVEAELFTPPGEAGLDAADSPYENGYFAVTRPPGRGGAVWGIALLALLGAAGRAQAQDVPGNLTGPLSQSVVRARVLDVAPSLQRSLAALQRAAALRSSAGLLPATEVFATVDGQPIADVTAERETAGGVAQTIPLPPVLTARRRAAQKLIEQAEAEHAVVRRAVLLDADLAYVDLLAGQTRLALADSALVLAQAFAAAAERRQGLGETGVLEALQARVAVAQAERERAASAGAFESAAAVLRTLLDLAPGAPVRAEGVLTLSPPPRRWTYSKPGWTPSPRWLPPELPWPSPAPRGGSWPWRNGLRRASRRPTRRSAGGVAISRAASAWRCRSSACSTGGRTAPPRPPWSGPRRNANGWPSGCARACGAATLRGWPPARRPRPSPDGCCRRPKKLTASPSACGRSARPRTSKSSAHRRRCSRRRLPPWTRSTKPPACAPKSISSAAPTRPRSAADASSYRLFADMNTYLNTLRLLFSLLLLLATGCGRDEIPNDAHADDAHDEGEAGEVRFEEAALALAGIETTPVARTTLRGAFGTPGRAVPGLTGTAHIGTLLPGRVVRLFAGEGAGVRRGGPLAEIESFAVAELKADLIEARARLDQSHAALERQQQLAAEHLTPERELEGARAAYRSAQASVGAATTKLAALGIDPHAVAGDGPQSARFTVRTPIGGTVTRREVQLGDYVEPSRDLFEVSASGSNLVEAQVPSERAAAIHAGQPVAVVLRDGTRHAGRVVSVAPVVSVESRTVPVRVELAAASLRPETFVTVRFETDTAREALVVPTAAIERAGGEAFVYVAVEGEPGAFRRVPVALGSETADGIEIVSGVEPGAHVVVVGVFYLRSQRQKGDLAEHDH